MSHFAKIEDGKVKEVIVAEQDYIDGIDGTWVQTSYNTRGNVHYGSDGEPDGGVALRGNYAGEGDTYDSENDVFYSPQPYDSWTLNQTTWLWEPPTPYPTPLDNEAYNWNEETQTWDEIT